MSFICSGCRRPTPYLFAQPEGGGCLCQGCNGAAASRRELSALRSEIVALRSELDAGTSRRTGEAHVEILLREHEP